MICTHYSQRKDMDTQAPPCTNVQQVVWRINFRSSQNAYCEFMERMSTIKARQISMRRSQQKGPARTMISYSREATRAAPQIHTRRVTVKVTLHALSMHTSHSLASKRPESKTVPSQRKETCTSLDLHPHTFSL